MAEEYYSISPYVYCNNNPMRYVDPTGMFYIDKNKSKVYAKNGGVFLKTENLNWSTRGRINAVSRDTKRWRPGTIGANTKVGSLSYGSSEPTPGPVGPDENDMRGKATTKAPASKTVAKGLLILDAINEGFNVIDQFAVFNDKNNINEHSNLMNKAVNDVNNALESDMISEEYRSVSNISAIINYVFQQENVTDDKNIETIGNQIIEEISKKRK